MDTSDASNNEKILESSGWSVVSVIIPCYNNENYVESAIESALNQTYLHREVIVIDDGSTDNSLDIIRSYGDRIRWESGPNQGAPAARNRGLELACGKYVKFLDADDVLLPDCLERQVKQAETLPANRKAIVYGDATWMDEAGNELPGHDLRPREPGEDLVAHILSSNPLTSCPLHRRDYLLEVGGFDPSIPRGQEFDLHLRLVLSGVGFKYHPGPVYRYRHFESEERISGQGYSQDDALALCGIVLRHERLIEEKRGQISEEIRALLAQRLWAYGRGVLREGHAGAANRYFEEARRLAGQDGIAGNFPYPTLARWFGPQRAEKMTATLKRTVGRTAE